MWQMSHCQSQCRLHPLSSHLSASGIGFQRSHGFGIPGTARVPVALSLPAGHRLSAEPELMLFEDAKLEELE